MVVQTIQPLLLCLLSPTSLLATNCFATSGESITDVSNPLPYHTTIRNSKSVPNSRWNRNKGVLKLLLIPSVQNINANKIIDTEIIRTAVVSPIASGVPTVEQRESPLEGTPVSVIPSSHTREQPPRRGDHLNGCYAGIMDNYKV